jgi:hypothetical protein
MQVEGVPHEAVQAGRDQCSFVDGQPVHPYGQGPAADDHEREAHSGDDQARDL